MGLAEQIKAGGSLVRKTNTFTTDAIGSGSVALGSAYSILAIESSVPCRLRFYDDIDSLKNAGEVARTFGDTNISASVALIGDFSMSVAGRYTVDPILFGIPATASTALTWYRIEPASPAASVTVTNYILEDIPPTAGTFYTIDNRRALPDISATLGSGGQASGSIVDSSIPATYLLMSASLASAAQVARLRLYSTTSSLSSSAEKARPFTTEPSASAYLIADMIISGSEITKFSPKIVGANLDNMGTNLSLIRGNQTLINGKSELHYVLNRTDGGASATVTVNLHAFSLED